MKTPSPRINQDYLNQVKSFPLVQINTDKHLKEAFTVLDKLLDRRRKGVLTKGEKEYMDVLSDLVYKYEQEKYPIEKISPVEALRYLMEENGLRQADLAHLFSSKSNLSEILSGRRQISKEQAIRLAERFKVSVGTFIG